MCGVILHGFIIIIINTGKENSEISCWFQMFDFINIKLTIECA